MKGRILRTILRAKGTLLPKEGSILVEEGLFLPSMETLLSEMETFLWNLSPVGERITFPHWEAWQAPLQFAFAIGKRANAYSFYRKPPCMTLSVKAGAPPMTRLAEHYRVHTTIISRTGDRLIVQV